MKSCYNVTILILEFWSSDGDFNKTIQQQASKSICFAINPKSFLLSKRSSESIYENDAVKVVLGSDHITNSNKIVKH